MRGERGRERGGGGKRTYVVRYTVSKPITSYPVVGSRAIPRGFFISSLKRTVRLVPVRSETVT